MQKTLSTKVRLLDSKAELPKKAHDSDSGYDIKSIGVSKIEGDVIFFKTGLSIQPPDGYYFEVYPRSSISGLPLMLANSVGIIDQHYTGEILIPVRITHSGMGQDLKSVSFPNGIVKMFGSKPSTMSIVAQLVLDKKPILFQLILRKRLDTNFVLVESLDETIRGSGGFGSSDSK
jgi:dUTP pyrophosphatase